MTCGRDAGRVGGQRDRCTAAVACAELSPLNAAIVPSAWSMEARRMLKARMNT